MLNELTHDDFQKHLDTVFTIHYSETDSFDAVLIEAKTIGQKPEKEGLRWSFSIVLHVPVRDKYLIQQIYQVTHPEMGALSLFLVPLGPDETGFRYEAVFT